MKSARYCCLILVKPIFSWQIFENPSNIKFHKNPSIGIRAVPSGQTVSHDEPDSFLNYAKASQE